MDRVVLRQLLKLATQAGDEEAMAYYSQQLATEVITHRTCMDMRAITKAKLQAKKNKTANQNAYLRRHNQGEKR